MKRWLAMVVAVFAAVFLLALCIHRSWNAMPTEPTCASEVATQSTQESVPDEMKPVWEYDPLKYKLEHYYQFVGEDPGEDIQYLPETVENPDDLPVLKWVCVTQRMQTWTEDAVRELNRMLADRGMPYRVQFVMITGNSTLYSKLLSLPEIQGLLREADLLWARMTPEQRESFCFLLRSM